MTGTLTTPEGSGKISEQLVVHFTGPDELLGSGHPPPGNTDLPPPPGLIRSGGLLVGSQFGQSQMDPETLYALLLDGTVRRSEDGGRTWSVLVAPPG